MARQEPKITVELTDEFLDRLAEVYTQQSLAQSLAEAGRAGPTIACAPRQLPMRGEDGKGKASKGH